eukprot:CAMPEP_0195300814 /NCGR_PEP_ID=MMETSP0707-20130614/28173_1 /TAXON_ID=33640 /ORGANISM="Asterionellopsis glacialis, Strain CCMP134" /LENGTH=758 /DNA_ID=CAMNT_0040363613 /DNA_START=191 /DNA_END=2464 /DNA_ORIENTATION=+
MARVESRMSQYQDTQERRHSHDISASPPELSFHRNGQYGDRKEIKRLREKRGYCRTCPEEPVQLYDIRKGEISTSWSSRIPRSVEGECFVGVCLICHPDLDPQYFAEKKPHAPFHELNDQSSELKSFPPKPPAVLPSRRSSHGEMSYAHLSLPNEPNSSTAAATASLPTAGMNSAPAGLSCDPYGVLQRDAIGYGGDGDDYNDNEYDENDRKPPSRQGQSQTSNQSSRTINSKDWSGRRESIFDDVDQYVDLLECVYEERQGTMLINSDRKLVTAEEKKCEESTANELETLLVDLLQSGDADVTLNVLLDAMRSYPTGIAVQKLCLRVMVGLAKDNEDNKDLIVSSNAPELILISMKRHVYENVIQEEGCRLLWSLALCRDNILPLISEGAVPRVMRAVLENMLDERLVHVALGALRALSPQMVRHSIIPLHGKNLVLQVMNMHRKSSVIQRDGILILANVSIDKKNHHVAVASKEEFQSIINAMNQHARMTGVMSVISVACFALKNYSYEETNLRELSKSKDVMPCLKQAVEFAEDHDCRKDAHDVFDRIRRFISKESERNSSSTTAASARADSRNSPSLQDSDDCPLFHTDLSPDEIFSHMLNYANSTEIAEDGLYTLLMQALESPRKLSALLEVGAPRKVIAVMTHHDSIPEVQENGCKLLMCLSGSTYNDRDFVRNAGAVKAIMQSMHEQFYGDEGVQIAAFRALNVLAVDFECWFELMQDDSMNVIEQAFAVHMGIPDLEIEGFELLQKLSSH